ncbi:MAG: terminase small subunit [Verrucomicrobiae bacterium]
MSILSNPKHEAFARKVAEGKRFGTAYRSVYGKKGLDSHASRLARNGKVSARIKELQQKSESKTLLTIQERRQFLADVVRVKVRETPLSSPLIQSIKTGKDGIEIRVPDKIKALELDAKMAGELVEKQETTHVLPGSLEEAVIELIHGKKRD